MLTLSQHIRNAAPVLFLLTYISHLAADAWQRECGMQVCLPER
jgi:hypothetical protein